ncbi:hypothetical protein [Thiorhodovibrio winogradskyi]|uniref:hypothetical protein n=1 Tax=Thiorhodovibrio winogradskyi TaxID=77007 RepID=UPI002E2D6F6D|nr:hypothetical protein [Thiorhodovibrio winogradskyi]
MLELASLARFLNTLDALPEGARDLVTAHHPLREVGTKGTALTRHGQKALLRNSPNARCSRVMSMMPLTSPSRAWRGRCA